MPGGPCSKRWRRRGGWTCSSTTPPSLGCRLHRAAQPFALAPAYVYLASDDARYVTGQILHVNGGTRIPT